MKVANVNFQSTHPLIAWPARRGIGLDTSVLTLGQMRRIAYSTPSAPKKLKGAKPLNLS